MGEGSNFTLKRNVKYIKYSDFLPVEVDLEYILESFKLMPLKNIKL